MLGYYYYLLLTTYYLLGSGLPGMVPTGTRQQAWYEDERSIGSKLALAAAHNLLGVGVWAANGLNDRSALSTKVWELFVRYVQHQPSNSS